MFGLLYNLIQDAALVMYGKPQSVTSDTCRLLCTHVFKGVIHITETVSCVIPQKGMETPEFNPGTEYLVILRKDTDGTGFTMLPKSSPIEIPAAQRAPIAEILHEYANIAQIPDGSYDSALQHLVLRMLSTNIPLFEQDGAKLANKVKTWDPEAMKKLRKIVEGTETRHPLTGGPRGDAVFVIIVKSNLSTLEEFVIHQIETGNADDVYYGLMGRSPEDATFFLKKLVQNHIKDSNRVSALLRISGLMRRDDLLDCFEKEYNPESGSHFAEALKSAREFVDR